MAGLLERFRAWRRDRHREAARRALDADRAEEALRALRAALGWAEALGAGDPRLAESLDELARALQRAAPGGAAEEIVVLIERGLAEDEARLGATPVALADRVEAAAQLHRTGKRFAAAEALYRRSLTILEAELGPDHDRTVQCLDGLAAAVFRQRRWPDAEALYRRLLACEEAQHGSDGLELASTLNRLAQTVRSQLRNHEAMALEERVAAIRDRHAGVPPAEG